MKKHLILSLTLLSTATAFSQEPAIQWQNAIGGTGSDILYVSIPTPDGGYILGGTSTSPISGDKTEGVIGGILSYRDYWIIKLNAAGSVVWQNTIGGNNDDYFTSLEATSDGGYIVGGYSRSPVSGDKTEAPVGGGTSYFDYWVLKLDAAGNIVWQNTIGGTDDDHLWTVKQTSDGGYILAGYSESGVSADKSEPNMGVIDYWVVKLNASGVIQWENTYGGSASDQLYDIVELPGEGYVLGGNSASPVSGDKTEGSFGQQDYWILKIDLLGNIIWQNTIGKTTTDLFASLNKAPDNGFLLAGNSKPDILATDEQDIWLVKTDESGNVIWEDTIGGNDEDEVYAVTPTPDLGFIISGRTSSYMSGDVNEDGFGLQDAWVIKIDENGNIVWQQLFGGNESESAFFCAPTPDNGYLVSCYSYSGISGDKTESSMGGADYWVIKLAPDDCIPQPVFADEDEDGYGIDVSSFSACEEPALYSFLNGDLNDLNDFISPSDAEICDGFDNDCDGVVDDGLGGCNPGPAIEWENNIGGSDEDFIGVVNQTPDGGFIVGGYSMSNISGDKTENTIGATTGDDWVLKLDPSGNILWQNTIGGNAGERMYDVKATTDGGYILGGVSYSPPSGDKSEISVSSDIWIVKLNAGGTVAWENTIIGSSYDELRSIQETADGGYIVGAYSESIAGYDKTETCFGGYDYWVIKLNASGNIVWQNTIGGNGDDVLSKIKQTPDGGYIIAGDSESGLSFDKTETNYGSNDYWIVKLNSSGAIEWQNTIAANQSDNMKDIVICADGGYLAGGYTNSSAMLDKTAPNVGVVDYWVIKLDASGNILWQKVIGGNSYDYLISLDCTPDNGFILGGYSSSKISGNKVERQLGQTDYWIVKLDEAGNIEWQNTMGGKSNDELSSIAPTADGGFIIGGQSKSAAFYDKSEDNFGKYDYWIIKLAGACMPEICNTVDDDCNGLIDDDITETISISAGGPTTFCQGDGVLLSAIHSGISLQWKKNGVNIPGATGASYLVNKSGNYTCVTTSACDSEESAVIAVTVNKNPAASVSAVGSTTFCEGGSVTLDVVPVGGSTYQWYKGASPLAGATNTSYIATTAGNYKCRVTKTATGCYKNSNAISVTVPCKEGEATHHSSFTTHSFPLYPNPNNGIFTISGSLHEANIEIYNSLGQLVYQKQAGVGVSIETIELKDISPGVYSITIHKSELQSKQQFIIQN